jgi:predicted sugar kinase
MEETMHTIEELIAQACQLSPQERQRLVAAVEASLVADVVAPDDASHETWAAEMQEVLSEFRQGASGYSEAEIDQMIDAAVAAVRRGQRPAKA